MDDQIIEWANITIRDCVPFTIPDDQIRVTGKPTHFGLTVVKLECQDKAGTWHTLEQAKAENLVNATLLLFYYVGHFRDRIARNVQICANGKVD